MFACEISLEFSVDHVQTARRVHSEILEVIKKYKYLFDQMPTLEIFEDVISGSDHDEDSDYDDDDEWNEYDRDE